MNQELRNLVLESLREKQDSYAIKELFEKFPTATELIAATEIQLQSIKTKALTYPEQSTDAIRSPKDVYNLLEPELRYEQKEHFICLFLNTKSRLIFKEVISIGSLNAAIVRPFSSSISRIVNLTYSCHEKNASSAL